MEKSHHSMPIVFGDRESNNDEPYTKDLLIPREAKAISDKCPLPHLSFWLERLNPHASASQGGQSHCRFLCRLPQHSQRGRSYCRYFCPLAKEAVVTDVTCVPCRSLRSRRGQNRACTCSSRSGSTPPQSRHSSTSFLRK
jgi:hypothetical protein